MWKLIINTWKIMISFMYFYRKYWDVNNLYGWAMSQKLSIHSFKWVEETPQFNEDWIKGYDEDINTGYFLEVEVQYP